MRVLFAGGGTGGHIFPALAVAKEVRERYPDAEILFIGTKGKIEERVVPENGFAFRKIWISGIQRRFSADNLLIPVKLVVSMLQSLAICMKFKPQVAVGTGGYAAWPAISMAKVMGAKVIMIEPNSYPGVTTRLLEKKADDLYLAFENAAKYLRFPSKHRFEGNPIRKDIKLSDKSGAKNALGFDPGKKVILIVGGSLGATKVNRLIAKEIDKLKAAGIQLLWQTGKNEAAEYQSLESTGIRVKGFIENMSEAYSASDLVISRSGAGAVAEIAALGLPAIFVPSPYVAENHQYHNARGLAELNGCILIEEKNIGEELINTIITVINDEEKLKSLSESASRFAKKDAVIKITDKISEYVRK